MKVPDGTKEELIEEMGALKQRLQELEQSESRFIRNGEILRALLGLHEYASPHNMKELLTKTLDELEMLTGSQIGFFLFLSPDERTVSLQTWSTYTLNKMCATEPIENQYSIDQAGVWADCVRERQAVIHNDYENLPHRKGIPPGHAPVIRELVVPVTQHGRIVAILGVGNKPDDYLAEDVDIVTKMAFLAWTSIERKRLEDLLRESEERHRSVVEDQTEVISRFLHDGTFTFVNNAYCRFFGKPIAELIGKKWQPVVFPEDLPYIEEKLLTLSPSNPVVLIENRVYAGSGKIHWMQFINRGFFDPQGRLIEIQSVGRDITDRKRAEQELFEAENHYQMLFNSIDEGFCIIEMIFDENNNAHDYRFVETNPSFEKLTGLVGVQNKRRRELVLKPEEDWFEIFGKVALTGQSVRVVKRSEQFHRWYDVYAFRPNQTQNRRVAILFNDVTERVLVEEELISKTMALEEMNTALQVLIDHNKEAYRDIEQNIIANIRGGIIPYLERLKKTRLDIGQTALIEIVERNFRDISSPFLRFISSEQYRFTHKELEIISLVKEGKTTKEMAEILLIGKRTVDTYRNNIRHKLGLANKKVNLRTYLLSIGNT